MFLRVKGRSYRVVYLDFRRNIAVVKDKNKIKYLDLESEKELPPTVASARIFIPIPH